MSRLATAGSAYLRSAAHQPVDWYPWGPEAFARARADDKPILLDIGAVWCHWCHVMDRESYENPAIAELLNRDWICVKVDRDERPDVDARYQRAVQAISGQGGWPLTAFLTPDGQVFYGGTYFPADGSHGRPGLATVLAELARTFGAEREKVVEQAGLIRKHLEEHGRELSPGPLPPELLDRAADGVARVFDIRYGGFGGAPKFPHPAACDQLLARWWDTGVQWPRDIVDRTLVAMARGGIYDQLGGGFHRYTVDERWIVPHFEKMAYDNAELLRAYVHGAASLLTPHSPTPEAAAPADDVPAIYWHVVRGTARWVMSHLAHPEGGYHASQDADVGLEDDGDYFTWTVDEARAAVSEREFAVLAQRFDIEARGEMRHDPRRNVLWVRRSVREIAGVLELDADAVRAALASGMEKLAAVRARRPAPAVDRTCYTGWSAMLASAMLEAGALLDRADLDVHALATLERIARETVDPAGGFRHTLGGGAVSGLLDDQAHVAAAFLDAAEATGASGWVDRAATLMEHVSTAYRAPEGGLLDRRPDPGEGYLSQPMVPVVDAPTPSPNGVAALALARLAVHTGEGRWAARRDELLGALAGGLADLGLHGATLFRAVDWATQPVTHVVVVAEDDAPGRALHRAARVGYRPRKVVTLLRPGGAPAGAPAPVRAMLDGRAPRAYVCVGERCEAPTDEPATLLEVLARR